MSTALARRRSRGSPPVTMPSLASRLGLDSGVHRLLETPLSINGAEGSTILRFVGSQASAAGWAEHGGAGTLTLTGSGAVPTYGSSAPFLGSLDGGVAFGGATGRTFVGAAALWSPGTCDFVLEYVGVMPNATGTEIICGVSAAPRLLLYANNAAGYYVYVDDGSGASSTNVAAPVGTLVHLLAVGDRSGSLIIYRNATAGAAVDISAKTGTLTNTSASIGGYENQTTGTSATVLFLALHTRAAGWLDSHLQPTVAAQRFALLTASRPSFSIVPSTYPTAVGSTSPVYQQRRLAAGTDQLFYMGASAPTFDRIVDAAGRAVVGHLVEAAAENLRIQSNTFATSWSADHSSVPTTSVVCPDGVTRTTSTIHEDTSAGENHGVYGTATLVNGTYYTLRVFAKAAQRSFLELFCDGAARFARCYFNLTTAAAGTPAAGTAGARDLGGGWGEYWVRGAATADGAGTWHIRIAESISDDVFDGLNQDSVYVFGAQCETSDLPSSPVVTTTAAVTRAASSLKYSTANCLPRSEGSIVGAILCRSFTPSRARVLFSLDDGSANNRVELFTTATTGLLSALSRKASGTSGDVELTAHGSVFDNKIRPFMLTWNAAELALWVRDPTTRAWSVARDTSITPVAGSTFTTLCVGHDNATANHAGPGAYPLVDWALLPDHYDDPSQVRRGDSTLWEAY